MEASSPHYELVLSGGSLESPATLMHSGMGPYQVLEYAPYGTGKYHLELREEIPNEKSLVVSQLELTLDAEKFVTVQVIAKRGTTPKLVLIDDTLDDAAEPRVILYNLALPGAANVRVAKTKIAARIEIGDMGELSLPPEAQTVLIAFALESPQGKPEFLKINLDVSTVKHRSILFIKDSYGGIYPLITDDGVYVN